MSALHPSTAGKSGDDAEDIRLMELIGAADESAFEKLIERHQALVLGTVARMLGNNSEVEDIGQQVFIRVWKNAKRYEPRAKFTTWLLKITRNLVFNEMRRHKRHPLVVLEGESESDERRFRDERSPTPAASLLHAELEASIAAAIAALPDTQRMAVILRRYEDLSYEEIADVLEQSVPAVKSLLFRARKELRARLKSYLSV